MEYDRNGIRLQVKRERENKVTDGEWVRMRSFAFLIRKRNQRRAIYSVQSSFKRAADRLRCGSNATPRSKNAASDAEVDGWRAAVLRDAQVSSALLRAIIPTRSRHCWGWLIGALFCPAHAATRRSSRFVNFFVNFPPLPLCLFVSVKCIVNARCVRRTWRFLFLLLSAESTFSYRFFRQREISLADRRFVVRWLSSTIFCNCFQPCCTVRFRN